MADLDIPEGVITAWRVYVAATAEVSRQVELLPRGFDVAAGKASIAEEPYAELAAAQAAQHEALAALRALQWWETVDSEHAGVVALRRATGPQDAV
ncbi:hypothetical protein ACBJ59_36685 [Nonomuraea sp. MTCD27]|uniref:hypothetical protein n=1 Tax=Nonomuraea sp. MTCD27 TaxID=1676747 RepID=UPI0035C1B146